MDQQLETTEQRVAYIMSIVPQAQDNYLLLLLLYWQIFDGIDIPEDVVQAIVKNATQPTSIDRSKRKVMEKLRIKQLLELQRMAWAEVKEEAP